MDATIKETVTNIPCAICRRQFSRYTCPKCNIPYCSLICFRSVTHADCSESFYKKELETDIRTAPSKTTEERRQMMDLLKRFEEDSLDDPGLIDQLAKSDDDQEQDDDDFMSRFGNLDLENVSHDQLWSILKPGERERFMKALNDPSSDLAQRLLASDELEKQKIEPWWEAGDPDTDSAPEFDSVGGPSVQKHFGTKPKMMNIPETVVSASTKSLNQGPPLLYNIAATLIVYAYTTRFLATSPISSIDPADPDFSEAHQTISKVLPFLVDKKSTTVLPNLSALITDLWSRFEPENMTSSFFSVLLHDASKLLRPSPVTVLPSHPFSSDSDNLPSPYESHSSVIALLALSDLSTFFSTSLPTATHPSDANSKPRQMNSHITHKLKFYAARIISTPTSVLNVIADELMIRGEGVKREGISIDTVEKTDGTRRMIDLTEAEKTHNIDLSKPDGARESRRIAIEELT